MKRVHLLTTVAASLLLTAGTAAAQLKDAAPERAPAAQQQAPAEKVAPSMHSGQKGKSETTGQAIKSDDSGKADLKADDSSKSDLKSGRSKKPETSGQNQPARDSGKAEMKDSKDKSGAKAESKTDADVKKNAETKSDGKSDKSSATTGQGAAGAAKLSTEQRSKITTVIKKQNVKRIEPSSLNISIRVGTRVPRSVHYYPLPVQVVEVYPSWRGYDYILVGDQILVLDPTDHEIVAILPA
jgi:hypothetical protein